MDKTLFQVLNKMTEIALSGVNEAIVADVWEVEAVARKYPLMVLDPNLKSHTYQAGLFRLRVDMYIVDVVIEDESNELDVLSDMTGIAVQYLNYLSDKDGVYGFYIRKNIGTTFNFQTFTEKWDDSVAGVKVELSIDIPADGNICKNLFA